MRKKHSPSITSLLERRPRFTSLLAVCTFAAFSWFSLSASSFAQESPLVNATYTHAFDDKKAPTDKAEFFYPNETVNLSIQLKGRPKSGDVTAKFYFREDLIAEATLNVAQVNEGVIFSFGQNTFVAFDLKPQGSLPIGSSYRTEVTFDGKPLGTFPFKIAAPKGVMPTVFKSATLTKEVDDDGKAVGVVSTFEADDSVIIAGISDVGVGTWLEANWYVNGKLDPEGTRSLTLEEDKAVCPFHFSFTPAAGWPEGSHYVVLLVNGEEVSRQKFTTKGQSKMANVGAIEALETKLFRDNGKGEVGEEVTTFSTEDLIFHVETSLKQMAKVAGSKFVWTLLAADEGDDKGELAVAEIEEEIAKGPLTSVLTTKKGLPAGKYRVELIQNDKVLSSQDFSVR